MNTINITEWFDPSNIEHLLAYRRLMRKGYWPIGFIPIGSFFPCDWELRVLRKIADYYITEKLGY